MTDPIDKAFTAYRNRFIDKFSEFTQDGYQLDLLFQKFTFLLLGLMLSLGIGLLVVQ